MRRLLTLDKRWRTGLGVALAGMLMQTPGAWAATVPDLYQARVETAGRGVDDQRRAMSEALREVAVKVSGSTALDSDKLRPVLTRAESLVQSYAYEGGLRGEPLRMKVTFNGPAVEAALREADVPVWSSNRPDVLLWVILEENGKSRLAVAPGDAAIVDAVASQAMARGLPVRLPTRADARVLAAKGSEAQEAALKAASAGFGADVVASARLVQGNGGWRGDWQVLAVDGVRTQNFSGDEAAVVNGGVDWLVTDVASVYAKARTTDAAASGPLTFTVSGLRSVQDYAALTAYLKQLVVVRQVATQVLAGDTVTLTVTTDTGTDTLLQTLKSDARLEQVDTNLAAELENEAIAAAAAEAATLGEAPQGAGVETPAPAAPQPAPTTGFVFVWRG